MSPSTTTVAPLMGEFEESLYQILSVVFSRQVNTILVSLTDKLVLSILVILILKVLNNAQERKLLNGGMKLVEKNWMKSL